VVPRTFNATRMQIHSQTVRAKCRFRHTRGRILPNKNYRFRLISKTRRIFELFLIKRVGKYKLLRALFEIGWLIESGSVQILYQRSARARIHKPERL
jgi:hypothetical protein